MQQVQSISVKASNNTPFGTLRRSNSCLFDEHGTKCHKQDHNNQCHYCWTDSTATLYWIRNEKSWKQYVAHRVDEIRKLTPTKVCRHCPGIQNPADTGEQLSNNSLKVNYGGVVPSFSSTTSLNGLLLSVKRSRNSPL